MRRWKGTLRDVPCFILGNGPSMTDNPIAELLPGYFTIGINRAFKVIDPTILMWQDIELWMTERGELAKVNAVKYSRNASDPRGIAYQFKLMPGPYRLAPNPMILFGAGSTGPLAFQLAHSLGCKPIILLGYDCQYRGENTDFYGKNKHHKPHTLPNCQRGLRWVKTNETSSNIINCSDNNIFSRKHNLAEVIDRLSKSGVLKNHSREYYVEKLFSRKGDDF